MAYDEDYLSYAFSKMESDIKANYLQYVFTSRRLYIQQQRKLDIVIETHNRVPRKGAFAGMLNNGCRYHIFVNPQDVKDCPDLVRLLIAHELGHLCCRHDEEVRFLIEKDLGNLEDPSDPYSQYRELQEREADIFAANMLYSQGAVIERRVISEKEYESLIGDLPATPLRQEGDPNHDHGEDQNPSILNSAAVRLSIRLALRESQHVAPPIPLLCHSLADVLPEPLIQGLHRNVVAQRLHANYRNRINGPEKKPPLHRCDRCPDKTASMCKEEGSVADA